ncbi:MAG: aminotransferase class V-fold PLP-dependent enzyme [Nitrospinota bacterium]
MQQLSKSLITKIRSEFDFLEGYTFLNSAGVAPISNSATNGMKKFLNSGSWEGDSYFRLRANTIEDCRKLAGSIIGADSSEIAFVRSTSEGISLVASGLEYLPDDEVLISNLEYPSNVYPWLNLEQDQVKTVMIKSIDGKIDFDQFRNKMSPKTKLISTSSAQFATGFRPNLAKFSKIARDGGVLFLVDAIQTLGAFPIDVKSAKIDFLTAGSVKWLCGPEGIGIFFCSSNMLEKLKLTKVGWNSVVDPLAFHKIDFRFKKSAARFEEGASNLLGIVGLHYALELILSIGVEDIANHILELGDIFIDEISSHPEYEIVSPVDNISTRSGIILFAPKDRSAIDVLLEKLSKNRIIVAKRGDGIRVSPHFFNTVDDIMRLVSFL